LWDISGIYPIRWSRCRDIPGKTVWQVWESETVPDECQCLLAIYKGKGSRSVCKTYRGITLLSVPAKVFMHVILSPVKPTLLACLVHH